MPVKDFIPAGADLLGGLLGFALEGHEDQRQREQQQALTDIQVKGQKDLTGYNLELQKNLWDYTNYENQMEHLKKAGLNPALLYGKGGGGGATASLASGSVSGGTAAQQSGEIAQGRQMALQLSSQIALQQAQAEALKATAEKDRATATKISGVDTQLGETQISNLKEQTKNVKAQTALTNIQTELTNVEKSIKDAAAKDLISIIDLNAQKLQAEVNIIQRQDDINSQTKDDMIKTIQRQAYNEYLKGITMKSGVQLNTATIQKYAAEIQQKWTQLDQDGHWKIVNQMLQEAETKLTNKQVEYFLTNSIINGIGAAAGALKNVKSAIKPTSQTNNYIIKPPAEQ